MFVAALTTFHVMYAPLPVQQLLLNLFSLRLHAHSGRCISDTFWTSASKLQATYSYSCSPDIYPLSLIVLISSPPLIFKSEPFVRDYLFVPLILLLFPRVYS